MKMRRVFCFTLITLFLIVITVVSAQSPVDEVEDEENEEVARPIRASPRKRVRSRTNNKSNSNENQSNRGVQKRRLPAFRPTRAPLFEASPPDPFLDGEIGPNGHNGHSHSPPTRDPYYSPSRFEREKKRQRIKLTSEAPLRNSFDVSGSTEYNGNDPAYGAVPGKNYAFAYAVGDNAEDFSHKEAKDGQITIGEYRITLPDGRTQVVRYTAGGKHGYKADVTYEGAGHSKELPPAGPSSGYYRHKLSGPKQYHASVQPTVPFAPTPSPSYNSDRVYKSRPLKTTALYGEDDDVEYNDHPNPNPTGGTPKITIKGNSSPRLPTPTPEYVYNGNSVSTTPTPRPNSIYDKISPYRGGTGTKQGYKLDDLAYAHEHSPRAGPVRSKTRNLPVPSTPQQKGRSTAASYYDTQQVQGPKIKVSARPTKKYKDPATYYAGPHQSHQSQVNHVSTYVGPKHFQYLQETPVTHAYSPSPSPVPKQRKESHRHVVPLEQQYKSGGPIRVAYNNYANVKPKKLKKNKNYGIHQPLGQYLVQTPATAQTPGNYHHQSTPASSPRNYHHQSTPGAYRQQSTPGAYHQQSTPGAYQQSTPAGPLLPKEPFHYYNSFHQPHHHGFGEIAPSPTPSVATNSLVNNNNNNQQYHNPSPYPVTAYPNPTKPYNTERLRLPSPPSTSGHVYLETPASGARPNRLGIKEALSRLPNIPEAKTTVHPYEVGSADYGKSVGYSNLPHDPEQEQGFGQGFPSFDGVTEANLDPASFFSAGVGGGGGGIGDDQYFQNDQFNFLGGLNNFDIEQANVREIRQPKQGRRRQRRPGKRRGVPGTSPPVQEIETQPPSSRSQQSSEIITQPPKQQRRQQPTTNRGKGKRRRMRTQQPDPMMDAVESRRGRPRNNPTKVASRNES